MAVFLIPLAYMEATYYKCKPGNNGENPNHVDWFAYKPDLQFPVIVHIIISGIAWAGNLLLWIIALQYTTTFKASVITCSHPIMLTVYLYFLNMPVSLLEYLGVLVSFSGLILSSVQDLLENHQDPASTTLSDASNIDHTAAPHVDDAHEILGIILCLFSAACEVLVLFNRITTKKYVPLMQVMFYAPHLFPYFKISKIEIF